MTTKTEARKQAGAQAQRLARLAMRLQRASADKQDAILAEADDCLRRYKQARARASSARVTPINKQTVHEELAAVMPSLREVVQDTVRPWGFALFVFNSDGSGTDMSYAMNTPEDAVAELLRDWIVAVDRER